MGDAAADAPPLMLPSSVDVIVLGGGPAGLATAITLARLGQQVLLLTRPNQGGDKIGESLAPTATPILHQLSVWERFVAGGHLPCYGNQSCWGSADLRQYDFINDPNGHGWHIDRPLFERQLAEEATALGVQQSCAFALYTATRLHDRWQVSLRSIDKAATHPPLLTARFVVDATGRSSWFARRQGAQRLLDDRQVALVTFLHPTGAPLVATTTLVEAVEVGWWYSARVPDGRLVTMLMTDRDLLDHPLSTHPKITSPPAPDGSTDPDFGLRDLSIHQEREKGLITHEKWRQLLASAPYTAARIEQNGYQFGNLPRLVAAESGRLNQLWGEGWVAVGDAAMSYDPLAAHGLTLALAGGRDAALAVTAHFAGQQDALAAYAWRLESAYSQYTSRRQAYYGAEKRWPTAPYWQRRTLIAQG